MQTRDAVAEIKREWRQILPQLLEPARLKVNGETSYICPFCGHGSHGDGLTYNPKSQGQTELKCMGCGWGGSVIDLYMKMQNVEFMPAVDDLGRMVGISIDRTTPAASDFSDEWTGAGDAERAEIPFNPEEAAERPKQPEEPVKDNLPTETAGGPGNGTDGAGIDYSNERNTATPAAAADYTEYYKTCRERLTDPAALSYLQARGISLETARAYCVGYDPKADPAHAGHPSPRIILPTNRGHYVGRSIDPNAGKYAKMNVKGGTAGIFNEKALYTPDVKEVFIVEGAFDALSVLEVGGQAIGLNSTNQVPTLLKKLEEKPTEATLIICLDNDTAGKGAADNLRQGLQRLNIANITANISGAYKDPNEHLQQSRTSFLQAIQEATRQAGTRPDNISLYIDTLMGDDLRKFSKEIPTGFSNLDREIDGLYSGLYCVAATSSLGKTTFCSQLADQVAAGGQDVIYFTLEQSRLEMVSKSIARITAQHDLGSAVTSLSIRHGYLPQQVQDAAQEYKNKVGERVSVVEGNFSCDISFIGGYIRQYIRQTGCRPVCFIDYLQIVQPQTDEKGRTQNTKETVDTVITSLKRLSREMGLTIFVISSVNRANYMLPISFESLKESGGIEYSCDCVFGLQLACLNEDIFSKSEKIKEKRDRVKAAMAETPRKIHLQCLKNRYGIANFGCEFLYYPANDLFTPAKEFETFTESTTPIRRM